MNFNNSRKKTIVALHGFLGAPRDFDLWKKQSCDQWITPDLFSNPNFGPEVSLNEWGRSFNRSMLPSLSGDSERILLGYSMGGRLALHALIDDPEAWDRLILLSVNPGLGNVDDRVARIKSDALWARRFLDDDWQSLLADWNAQPVFIGSTEPIRLESDFERPLLAMAMNNWSLGLQRDFRPLLPEFASKLTWFAGEKDRKYAALLKELPGEVHIVEGCGHRLLDSMGILPSLS